MVIFRFDPGDALLVLFVFAGLAMDRLAAVVRWPALEFRGTTSRRTDFELDGGRGVEGVWCFG